MSEDHDFWLLKTHHDVGFFASVFGGALLLLQLPAWLWRLYVDYLWHWDVHPWVASAAATFELFAILVITPFALLSLLDVGAYVIARTLGVVETTQASTSDTKQSRDDYSDSDGSETEMVHVRVSPNQNETVAPTGAAAAAAPEARHIGAAPTGVDTPVSPPPPPQPSPSSSAAGPSLSNADDVSASTSYTRLGRKLTIPIPQARQSHFGNAIRGDGSEAEACFFSPSDERQLELSGALLSSPTPSRQASPGLERRQRVQPLQPISVDRVHIYDVHANSASSDASSTADSEPFTVLERPDLNKDGGLAGSDFADPTANLRRRTAGHGDDGPVVS